MLELLAITIWGEQDFLLVDMPPGIGDEVLDLLRFLPRAEFLVICTPSKIAVRVVARLVEMLQTMKAPLIGLIENMAASGPFSSLVADLSSSYHVPIVGRIPFVPQIDQILDQPDPLQSALGRGIQELVSGFST
jgi:ATP-binding protein involved in chromosome partitioning